jgi:hypothetical protein
LGDDFSITEIAKFAGKASGSVSDAATKVLQHASKIMAKQDVYLFGERCLLEKIQCFCSQV